MNADRDCRKLLLVIAAVGQEATNAHQIKRLNFFLDHGCANQVVHAGLRTVVSPACRCFARLVQRNGIFNKTILEAGAVDEMSVCTLSHSTVTGARRV